MITFILDASAAIRFLEKKSGWQRVAEVLEDNLSGLCNIIVPAVQWGEIAGKARRIGGVAEQSRVMQMLTHLLVTAVPVTPEQAVRAAELKIDRNIAYADAFALELVMRTPDHTLLTADYGFKAADDLAHIEYLPPI